MKTKSNGAGFVAAQMKAIVSTTQPYAQYATIVSVDTTKFTCSITLNLNSVQQYDNVPLAGFGTTGFIPVPSIGSIVVVVFFDPLHCCIVQTSSIDQYNISTSSLNLKTMLLNFADAVLNAQWLSSQGPTQPMGMINQDDIIQFKEDVNNLFL
jgi:hypothetical protein